jgi:hypothetical protein
MTDTDQHAACQCANDWQPLDPSATVAKGDHVRVELGEESALEFVVAEIDIDGDYLISDRSMVVVGRDYVRRRVADDERQWFIKQRPLPTDRPFWARMGGELVLALFFIDDCWNVMSAKQAGISAAGSDELAFVAWLTEPGAK